MRGVGWSGMGLGGWGNGKRQRIEMEPCVY